MNNKIKIQTIKPQFIFFYDSLNTSKLLLLFLDSVTLQKAYHGASPPLYREKGLTEI